MADDKKFGNNDFEDIYSSSEKNGYEDIYSDSEEEGRAVSSDKKGDDDFEDFFTTNQTTKISKMRLPFRTTER